MCNDGVDDTIGLAYIYLNLAFGACWVGYGACEGISLLLHQMLRERRLAVSGRVVDRICAADSKCDVQVAYEVAGESYTAEMIVGDEVGDELTLYYRPREPARATIARPMLVTRSHWNRVALLLGVGVLALAGA